MVEHVHNPPRKDAISTEKNDEILRLKIELREKEARIEQLQQAIELMRNTAGWRVLENLRTVREKVLPRESRRRRIFDLGMKSLTVLRNEGMRGFFVKVRRRLRIDRKPHSATAHGSIYLKEGLTKDPVTIIVPVYNGYQYVVDCIDSVLRFSNLTFHSLTIIDDKSSDERIRGYLEQLDLKDRNIEILYNDENIGFVKTANMGMRRSERDVILLNSDTVVTRGWIEKMQRAAFSRPKIATVTPFSNNATHCSIPAFLEENAVPQGHSIDSFAEFIEDISLRYYPGIPTAVGFCMYIKRDVLEKVGYFDERDFDRGYGEECDFCARASRLGFIHVLDDSTYIYHKGAVSFTPVKRSEIVDKRLTLIDRKYPEFMARVNTFYTENPLSVIHRYINHRMRQNS